MKFIHIKDAAHTVLEPRGIRAGADRGEPVVHSVSQTVEGASIGIWECQPGGWPVISRGDTEVCVIIDGTGTVTDLETNETAELSQGDVLILPKGWSGRWDLDESLRKVFVIY